MPPGSPRAQWYGTTVNDGNRIYHDAVSGVQCHNVEKACSRHEAAAPGPPG
jgi:hypothetical protein